MIIKVRRKNRRHDLEQPELVIRSTNIRTIVVIDTEPASSVELAAFSADQRTSAEIMITYRILARARHFSTLTPFTNSHRQKEASPINTGIKMPGMIALANAGAKKDEKQTTR